ncbi:hypothetical protein B0H11DRAFT_2045993, partial [Mycena galericulata]
MLSRHVFSETPLFFSVAPKYRTNAQRRVWGDSRRVVSTLDPSRLANADFVDISDLSSVQISFLRFNDTGDRLHYMAGPQGHIFPFPPRTRGFFYFRSAFDLSPLAGGLRFRISPNDISSSFSRGHDLLLPSGSPWELLLPRMVAHKTYATILKYLLSIGLVTYKQVGLCSRIFSDHGTIRGPVIYNIKQSFVVDFSVSPTLSFVGPSEILTSCVSTLFSEVSRRVRSYPYKGSALVRFERSPLPEHAGRRVLVLRVLEIINPVELVVPGYEGRVELPKAGELYSMRPRDNGPSKPWTYDLDLSYRIYSKTTKALSFLWT